MKNPALMFFIPPLFAIILTILHCYNIKNIFKDYNSYWGHTVKRRISYAKKLESVI